MKSGRAWGLKRHVWPVDFDTTTEYQTIPGLEDLSVEDIEHWTLWLRVLTAASVTDVNIQANEVPDAPAGDWASLLGYPQEFGGAAAEGWHRAVFKEGEYHKRIRVSIRAAGSGCTATVRSVWLGWGPWVEVKE